MDIVNMVPATCWRLISWLRLYQQYACLLNSNKYKALRQYAQKLHELHNRHCIAGVASVLCVSRSLGRCVSCT